MTTRSGFQPADGFSLPRREHKSLNLSSATRGVCFAHDGSGAPSGASRCGWGSSHGQAPGVGAKENRPQGSFPQRRGRDKGGLGTAERGKWVTAGTKRLTQGKEMQLRDRPTNGDIDSVWETLPTETEEWLGHQPAPQERGRGEQPSRGRAAAQGVTISPPSRAPPRPCSSSRVSPTPTGRLSLGRAARRQERPAAVGQDGPRTRPAPHQAMPQLWDKSPPKGPPPPAHTPGQGPPPPGKATAPAPSALLGTPGAIAAPTPGSPTAITGPGGIRTPSTAEVYAPKHTSHPETPPGTQVVCHAL